MSIKNYLSAASLGIALGGLGYSIDNITVIQRLRDDQVIQQLQYPRFAVPDSSEEKSYGNAALLGITVSLFGLGLWMVNDF